MILFFTILRFTQSISSEILTSSDLGFTIIRLRPKKSVKILLHDRMAVIPDGQPNTFGFSIKFTPKDDDPQIYDSFPIDSFTITGYELTLFSKKSNQDETVSIPLWLIPKSLCNGTNALINAEHHLLMNSKSTKFQGKVCLFSQTEFHSAKVEAILKSNDPFSKISFYENNNFNSDSSKETDANEPVKICLKDTKCHTHHLNPFFIVIQSKSQKAIKFKLDYEVRAPKPDIVYCQMNSIINVSPKGPKKSASVFEGTNVKCESRANDMLVVFKYIAIFVVILLAVVITLQCSGIIDLGDILCPDEEKKRFQNLKKDPYASRIDDPTLNSIDNDE